MTDGVTYTLMGADGKPYRSPTKGTLGGHRRSRIFGRLDCPSALRAVERGGYVRYRVFFADEATAARAGYRPCAVCLPDAYREWKALMAAEQAVDEVGGGDDGLGQRRGQVGTVDQFSAWTSHRLRPWVMTASNPDGPARRSTISTSS